MRIVVSRVALLCVVMGLGLIGVPRAARGQNAATPESAALVSSEVQGENRRESEIMVVPPDGEAPAIGFIESPTATCYQPDPTQDACYVNWYYLSVASAPNYMIEMELTLNQFGIVARYGGFFQQSMYVPYNMHGRGFKVACGPLGAGGDPDLGNAYSGTVWARDSANLTATNFFTLYCPAFTP